MLSFLTPKEKVRVPTNHRLIAFHEGRFLGLFGPGHHRLPNRRKTLEKYLYDLADPVFSAPFESEAVKHVNAGAETGALTVFRTNPDEVAIIERDGQLFDVLPRDRRLIVWTDAGPWRETKVRLGAEPVPMDMDTAIRLAKAGKSSFVLLARVPENHVGLMYFDGVLTRQLPTGAHSFWHLGKEQNVKTIDLRWQPLDVSGQELLTRDRVTIRVNLSARYRVTDPVRASTSVKDFADEIYRALQLGFRSALGSMSLDEILERKVAIGQETRDKIAHDLAAIGIEITDIELKDIILPGEMREILNRVVAAEKEAEANVIRRREETNATRSLLNTAKVMAENPVMLRLKELEALETIAEKVGHLTIHNGAEGLLNGLIRLRDK